MALVTTEATILKAYEYSETSKILRLFTRELGLCSVIAKGARRPKSRFGGLLEPFSDGLASFHTKQGRELHTLSGFELLRERQSLGSELLRYAGAGLLTEIVLRFAPAAGDEALFTQLGQGLDRLVRERGDVLSAILQETWRLIARLGFAPNVECCFLCGQAPSANEGTLFDLVNGGILCARCQPQAKASSLRPLTAEERTELVQLLSPGEWQAAKLRSGRAQRTLLTDFIAYHLADNRPLNSVRFLEVGLG